MRGFQVPKDRMDEVMTKLGERGIVRSLFIMLILRVLLRSRLMLRIGLCLRRFSKKLVLLKGLI